MNNTVSQRDIPIYNLSSFQRLTESRKHKLLIEVGSAFINEEAVDNISKIVQWHEQNVKGNWEYSSCGEPVYCDNSKYLKDISIKLVIVFDRAADAMLSRIKWCGFRVNSNVDSRKVY